MAWKGHGESAHHFSLQELDWLIEWIDGEALFAREGEIEERGERAMIEGRSHVVEDNAWGYCPMVYHLLLLLLLCGISSTGAW